MKATTCDCLLCSDRPAGADAFSVDIVRERGWMSLVVAREVDFAYTIGLQHSFGRPELVMFGLGEKGMPAWLNKCVDLCRVDGWPAEQVDFSGVIDGFATQLRPVHQSWYDALFGTAYRFYGDFPPVLQLVWPDKHGFWPWDPQATMTCRQRQPMAWLPVSEHPPGGWRLVGELTPNFRFPVDPVASVLTTKAILNGGQSPQRIVHDQQVFEILDERGYDADDLCLAYLGELVAKFPEVMECADLDEGQSANKGDNGRWVRSPQSNRARAVSKKIWEIAPAPTY